MFPNSISICIVLTTGTCLRAGLSLYGGAVHTGSERIYGCLNGCPTSGTQVHVIAHTLRADQNGNQVFG